MRQSLRQARRLAPEPAEVTGLPVAVWANRQLPQGAAGADSSAELFSSFGTAGGAKLEAHTPLGAMSEEQLKAFLEAVKTDAGLQMQLKFQASNSDAVVAIAKTAGFVITAEELTRAQAEISEDELEHVAGGGTRWSYFLWQKDKRGLPCQPS